MLQIILITLTWVVHLKLKKTNDSNTFKQFRSELYKTQLNKP